MQLRDMGDNTHKWELQCTLAVIPLSKLNPMRSSSRRSSSTTWMQACKRCAARAVNLAGVETNCIKCGQVIMVAGSVTLL